MPVEKDLPCIRNPNNSRFKLSELDGSTVIALCNQCDVLK